MLTSKQKNDIREFAKQKPIDLVYLFGSQAGGRTTPLSDYDFAVLFSERLDDSERFEEKLGIISFLTGILKTDKVDVVDLNTSPASFRYSAVFPRQIVFSKSESKRVDFEHKTMQEYFDQIFYIRRHTEQSLATIAREGLNLDGK